MYYFFDFFMIHTLCGAMFSAVVTAFVTFCFTKMSSAPSATTTTSAQTFDVGVVAAAAAILSSAGFALSKKR